MNGSEGKYRTERKRLMAENGNRAITVELGELMDSLLALAEEAHNAAPARDERRDAFYEAAAMVREALKKLDFARGRE